MMPTGTPRPHTYPATGLLRRGSAVAALLLGACLLAAPPPVKHRGKYIRTDTVGTEEQPFYSCRLAHAENSVPRLLFSRQNLLTHRRVRVYETVLEMSGGEERDPTKTVYRIVPDEETRGESYTEQETVDRGPFADETFRVNGVAIRTDAEGMAEDPEQRILALFDDLSKRYADLVIEHPLGTITLKLSRDINVAHDPGEFPADVLAGTDIAVAMGVDLTPIRKVDREKLTYNVNCPDTVRPGDRVEIRLTVNKDGDNPAGAIIGRIFSRRPWLHGRNLYIGNVPPGASRTFARYVRVPEDAPPGDLYLAIGLWDILGTMPNGQIPIRLTIVPGKADE